MATANRKDPTYALRQPQHLDHTQVRRQLARLHHYTPERTPLGEEPFLPPTLTAARRRHQARTP
jgi:hypothetical protein